MSQFEKSCGNFGLIVGDPNPSWVTIEWQGNELEEAGGGRAHVRIEDLQDLRYLIDRALETVKA